nr:LEAF RUST 10 DISEASE-RESISTANCE LOCUS RECEPTOR-LIKE PROTEIN KINASE-like 2.1 [Ipomoea batatas]
MDTLRRIENEELNADKVEVLDIVVDDLALLKGNATSSPDSSVTDKGASSSTPNSIGSVYEACAESFSCGDIDGIAYPFWGGNQPAYCGHPSFELSCNDESHPEISILSVKYKVLGISSQAATIVRDDLLSNICPSNPQRTSLDLNLFSYTPSGNQNITLFYGCTITNTAVSLASIPYLINCTEEISDSNKNVLWSPGTGLPTIPGIPSNIFSCGSEIFVTVTQQAFDGLVKASLVTEDLLRTSVGAGFSVNWKANNSLCDNCTESGGRCGSNGDPISTQFICFIGNAMHPSLFLFHGS